MDHQFLFEQQRPAGRAAVTTRAAIGADDFAAAQILADLAAYGNRHPELAYQRTVDDALAAATFPFLSLIPAIITHKIWHRYTLYWQRLLLLLTALTLNTVLHGIAIGPWLHSQLTQTLLATFTGGVLLIPFIYLLYEYIKQQHLQTLLAQEIPDPPLRTSLLIWCSLFFLSAFACK